MRTIFITGGATGIGAASVRKFIREGWSVGFMDVNRQEAMKLTEELGSPETLLYVPGNVCDREDIRHAVDLTIERFGSLTSVFANAGIHRRNSLREAIPHIIEAGGGSVVINCSDQWFVGKAHSFAYGLTKGALGQITRSLSVDLGPEGVRVNAICPGTIHTPLVDNLFEKSSLRDNRPVEELWKEENSLYARGSVGTPDEVAELVYFLASEKSSFCTGGHYLIDGGLVAGR